MTNNAINIAIAECCGWKFDGRDVWTSPDGHEHQALYGSEDKYGTPLPPSYCTDLNAMHEAEETLECKDFNKPDDMKLYREILELLSAKQMGGAIRATAAQRAEAFLRVKGLWREKPESV